MNSFDPLHRIVDICVSQRLPYEQTLWMNENEFNETKEWLESFAKSAIMYKNGGVGLANEPIAINYCGVKFNIIPY